ADEPRVGAPDAVEERDRREGQTDRDEHLFDVPVVELLHQDPLGRRGEDRPRQGTDQQRDGEAGPRRGAEPLGDLEAQEGTEGQEDAVGEVQHAHQAVDEGQTARDEEVDGAQANPGDRQEDHGAHMTPSDPVDTPSRRCVSSASLRNSAAGPWWTLRPPVRTTAWWASSRTTCRFCSTRRTGTTSAARASTRPT